MSVESPEFRRGVSYLVSNQKEDGAWPSINSHSKRPSEFAPTMWAVIGLAGSFRESKMGTLQVVSELDPSEGEKSGSRGNILIVLDESGSMKAKLGKSTRIATARTVIREVLDMMPVDAKIGLRLYGHRAKPSTKETCTDTEMALPIAPVDRNRFIDAVEKTEPRGDTPLVYATLKAPEDLKPFGGGSVILIADGEESCGGNLEEAAKQLKASGVDLTLDIVGFTITGKKTEASLGALAEATGGHYYPASDGDALQRSLAAATFRYPYAMLDKAGHTVAKGTADSAPTELKPGDYQVIVYAGGKQLKREQVTVKAAEDITLHLRANGERSAFID